MSTVVDTNMCTGAAVLLQTGAWAWFLVGGQEQGDIVVCDCAIVQVAQSSAAPALPSQCEGVQRFGAVLFVC